MILVELLLIRFVHLNDFLENVVVFRRQIDFESNYMVTTEKLGIVVIWWVELRYAVVFQHHGISRADTGFNSYCRGAADGLHSDLTTQKGLTKSQTNFRFDILTISLIERVLCDINGE